MAKGHGDDETAQDEPTDATAGSKRLGRRSMLKAVGAAAALGGVAGFSGSAAAAPVNLSGGDMTIAAGEYEWDGSGLDNSSGEAIVGEGSPGDVVLNLESGTMDGSIGGRLENVVVRGANNAPKSGIDLSPGATLDGFIWPEGGQQSEDRALYTPDGGNDRITIQNSSWAWMVNNGAYVDKPPVTMENCAALNNNIANIRVGHRDGTDESATTVIRNCLIAVTDDILNDDTNVPHSRGIRLRNPADLLIENCWFIYLDVDGTADLVELHDEAAGSTVTIRDCAFYNDSNGSLVRDKSSGGMDVTIENCTVTGSGSRTVEPEFSGSGFTEDDSVTFPYPSEVTGYAAADEAAGVGAGIGPWGSSSSTTTESSLSKTLALHASPDNASTVEASFTVDGPVEFAADAESDTDSIVDNGDGTNTATSVLAPDELDSFRFDGSVVDYSVPSDATVDVSLDGTTTTFAQLVGENDSTETSTDDGTETATDNADVLEVIARQAGGLDYGFVVDGSVELHETSTMVTAGNGDTVTDNGDGTVTVDGFTGNDGYGDAYLVDGSIQSFSWTPDDYAFDVLLNGDLVDPLAFGSTETETPTETETETETSTDTATETETETATETETETETETPTETETETSADTETETPTETPTEQEPVGDDTLPHRIVIDGDTVDVTTYTFTVSESVVRDTTVSESTDDGSQWDRFEDIARDGKVIGLVGSGVDAYRFDGNVTGISIRGDASIDIQRNV